MGGQGLKKKRSNQKCKGAAEVGPANILQGVVDPTYRVGTAVIKAKYQGVYEGGL
jgi:hypothetical protein